VKPISIAGILFVVLGAFALAYQRIDYTHRKKIIDAGPIHATEDERKSIPVPPIVGAVILAGGVAMLVIGARQKSS